MARAPSSRRRRRGGRLPRGLLLVVGAILVGACAGRGGDDLRARFGPPSQAVPGVATRQCSYLQPERLDELHDMTRLGMRGNLALWGAGGDPDQFAVFSIRYDEEGELEWVRPIQSSAPAERVKSLERLLRGSVAEQGPADWGFRLRVGDDGGGVQVMPSVLCPVRVAHFDASNARVFGTSYEMREANLVRGRRFDVEVAVDPLGRVVGARLPQSSGSRIVDETALDVVRSASFHPELHDGFGVPSTYMFPLRFGRRF